MCGVHSVKASSMMKTPRAECNICNSACYNLKAFPPKILKFAVGKNFFRRKPTKCIFAIKALYITFMAKESK